MSGYLGEYSWCQGIWGRIPGVRVFGGEFLVSGFFLEVFLVYGYYLVPVTDSVIQLSQYSSANPSGIIICIYRCGCVTVAQSYRKWFAREPLLAPEEPPETFPLG